MTATRCVMCSTIARSWLMNSSASPSLVLQIGQQIGNLRLHRHIERRDRLVADDARPASGASARAMQIRWRWPPENSCGKPSHRRRAAGGPCRGGRPPGRRCPPGGCAPRARFQIGSAMMSPHPHARAEAAERILEHHLDLRRRMAAAGCGQRQMRSEPSPRRARSRRRWGRVSCRMVRPSGGLAAAAFADHRTGSRRAEARSSSPSTAWTAPRSERPNSFPVRTGKCLVSDEHLEERLRAHAADLRCGGRVVGIMAGGEDCRPASRRVPGRVPPLTQSAVAIGQRGNEGAALDRLGGGSGTRPGISDQTHAPELGSSAAMSMPTGAARHPGGRVCRGAAADCGRSRATERLFQLAAGIHDDRPDRPSRPPRRGSWVMRMIAEPKPGL